MIGLFSILLVLHHSDFRVDEWQQTEFIWNFALISLCDQGVPESPVQHFESDPDFDPSLYQNIQRGDIVWIKCRHIPRFYEEVLPYVKHPFIALVNDGDESFPDDIPEGFNAEDFIVNEMVFHIFAQNAAGLSVKVSPIPIGIDFHTIGYKSVNGGWGEIGTPHQQEDVLASLLQRLPPTNQRKKRIFVDFHHSDTMHGEYQRYLQFGEDRASIFRRLLATGLVDHSGFMKRTQVWETKGQYAFSVSPHGNGLDCHRTWEDLALGCIVIVKTSPLDPLYEGLPVVIVNDWSEINEANLDAWLEKFGDAYTNPSYREKLTARYWFGKIQAKKRELEKR